MGDPYGDLLQNVTGHFLCIYVQVRVYEFIRQSTLSRTTLVMVLVYVLVLMVYHSVGLTYVCVVCGMYEPVINYVSASYIRTSILAQFEIL